VRARSKIFLPSVRLKLHFEINLKKSFGNWLSFEGYGCPDQKLNPIMTVADSPKAPKEATQATLHLNPLNDTFQVLFSNQGEL
jgi:hypothetical protein